MLHWGFLHGSWTGPGAWRPLWPYDDFFFFMGHQGQSVGERRPWPQWNSHTGAHSTWTLSVKYTLNIVSSLQSISSIENTKKKTNYHPVGQQTFRKWTAAEFPPANEVSSFNTQHQNSTSVLLFVQHLSQPPQQILNMINLFNQSSGSRKSWSKSALSVIQFNIAVVQE